MSNEELIGRLETAEGPSRELDRDFAEAAGWQRKVPGDPNSDDYWRWGDHSWTREDGEEHPPRYTASLDAIVGLIERELPGWGFDLTVSSSGRCSTRIWPGTSFAENERQTRFGSNPRPALALCIAFLKARAAIGAAP